MLSYTLAMFNSFFWGGGGEGGVERIPGNSG